MTGADREQLKQLELTVSDPTQVGSLEVLLRLASSAATVSRVPGVPGERELGATDVLVLVASSSGLVAAIKVLPEFLRSRKSSMSIKATVKGEPFTLTVTNVDDVMPILERFLDA
jgi:Effector Associated Constant Component 1